MQCDRCKTVLQAGEENEHLGQSLCEDCYMDALSPVRTCDPWAAHSAKTFETLMGGQATLTDLQKSILTPGLDTLSKQTRHPARLLNVVLPPWRSGSVF